MDQKPFYLKFRASFPKEKSLENSLLKSRIQRRRYLE